MVLLQSFPFLRYFFIRGTQFSLIRAMSSKRKEYKVDARAKKAALFFLACEPNPVTRLSIPAAMRAKGYSDSETADRILVQQVHRKSQKKNPMILLVPSLRPRHLYWPWQRLHQRQAAGRRYEQSRRIRRLLPSCVRGCVAAVVFNIGSTNNQLIRIVENKRIAVAGQRSLLNNQLLPFGCQLVRQ